MNPDQPRKFASVRPNRLAAGLHSRGALPHLKREGATYFVTFRLSGTLPREVLLQLKRERENILHKAELAKRPLTWRERKELFNWYAERVDAHLDAGLGECWLRRPGVAGLVVGALRHFEGERYSLSDWVVMPNHVHVVVRPAPPRTLSEILKSWKSYTAVHANRLLGRVGNRFWQSESYDHCCRNDDDLARCQAYTILNPVNAGLCERPEDWPWSSAHVRQVVGRVSDLPVRATSGCQTVDAKAPTSEHVHPSKPTPDQTRLLSKPEPSGQRPDPRRRGRHA